MADKKEKPSNGSVFISYSRKDKVFIQKLNDALDNAGVNAWVDWEGIELASDWMQRITAAIQGSDAFLFVMSPDSLKSKVCAEELELGIKSNKKIIPILFRDPAKDSKIHPVLGSTNWVYLRKKDNFDETIPRLIEAINTDLEWVSQHTRLLERGLEWEAKNNNHSYLLQGTDLEDAERWQTEASGKPNRNVVPIQAQYIMASRQAAGRRQRLIVTSITFALILSIALSIWAIFASISAKNAEADAVQQKENAEISEAIAIENQHAAATAQANAEANEKEAKAQTNLANAQRSAALAQINQSLPGELEMSTLLAIDSWQRNASFQAEDLIRTNNSLLPIPIAQMSQDGQIFNIEWSPDYEYFVTGNKSDDADKGAKNYACVWQADNGEKVKCVEHDDDVTDALFSPDGKYLITASTDKTVRFWDANTWEENAEKRLTFGGAVLDLDASQAVLAIGRDDNFLTLYYFNKPDIKPIHREIIYRVAGVKQQAGVNSVKFSPDGKFLAFGTTRGEVTFWQATNNFFYNGPKHQGSNYVVLAFSPDSNWLVTGGGDSLSRFTKRDGTEQYSRLHADWVEDVAFGPDPSWYVTVSDDNKVRVWEAASGVEKIRMSHSDFVQKVKVSPDGQWIASTGYDKIVRIWDSVSGSLMLEFPLGANGSAISFNKDGTRIVAADENGLIGMWDISSLSARLNYIEFPEFVHEARFTPSGESLIVNSDDYKVWKIPANSELTLQDGTKGQTILRANSLTYNTVISPDSLWAAVVENDNVNPQNNRGTLVSIDGRTVFPLEHGGEVTGVGFTNDNTLAITAGANGFISFWEIETGIKKPDDINNNEKVFSLSTSPVENLVVTGLHNKAIVWNYQTRNSVAELPQIGNIVTIIFSSDGKWLATGSSEGIVLLWKVENGSFTQTGNKIQLRGLPQMLAFSPDGKLLAGASTSGFAYLWDVATTQELTRIRHSESVTSVSFSLDGSQLITVSRKIVQIWDVFALSFANLEELIPFTCRRIISNLNQDTWQTLFAGDEYKLICPDRPEGN